nr:c-type cytochrome [Tellurirhabdus rosea]
MLPLLGMMGLVGLWHTFPQAEEHLIVAPAPDPKVAKLKLPEGFKAEHLYSPSENGQGSWVSMAFDDKGRMITSDQYGALFRLTIPAMASGSATPTIEKLTIGTDTSAVGGMGFAQGLLYAFNSLYVMVNNRPTARFPKPSGLYRLQDTNGDDQFDKVTLLKELVGEGEHGPHSVVLSPDKKSLIVVAGNHTDVPEMDAYRLPKVWKQDNLFPLIKDPRGHANNRMAPGGWIAQVDPEGKRWELLGAGFRNEFDVAFNEAGDMFTYDSDMEWDFGLPWYRPTRICHVTSGAEFGWRTGNSKWSARYTDNLPPVVNIGQGSPTNLIYVNRGRFPQKYQNTLLAFDWSFGIVHAIHLKPNGATYSGEREEFLSGLSLPLTDGLIGPDGALYFLTGGRRLESSLYRVYYDGPEKPVATNATLPLPEAHKIRASLEAYHTGGPKAGAVEAAWPYLKHADRFIQYAARIAVEHQPVSEWQGRALAEKAPRAVPQAAIALARHADSTSASVRSQLLTNLMVPGFAQLNEMEKQDVLRALEVVMARMGTPDGELKTKLSAFLNAGYPSKSAQLDRAYCRLLVTLDDPQGLVKTLALMDQKIPNDLTADETATASSDLIMRNPQYGLDIARMLAKVPPMQQTYLATMLSGQKAGWTPAQRQKYFSWFRTALNYQGGHSYIGFIDRARKLALQNVPKEQVATYSKLSGEELLSKNGNDLVVGAYPKGPGRRWSVTDALAVVDQGLEGRSFENGRNMYNAITCGRCHTMRGEGGAVGPDLTQLATRFSKKDMLEAILEPSKAVSDQYAATQFNLKKGESVVGRLVNEDKDAYYVSQNPFAPDQLRKVPKKEVTSSTLSNVSIMLPGLINSLNPDELKDLMAFLMAGGNQDHQVYKAAAGSGKGK